MIVIPFTSKRPVHPTMSVLYLNGHSFLCDYVFAQIHQYSNGASVHIVRLASIVGPQSSLAEVIRQLSDVSRARSNSGELRLHDGQVLPMYNVCLTTYMGTFAAAGMRLVEGATLMYLPEPAP